MAERAPESGPVVLFDGVCNLCTWGVQFIVSRDPDAEFSFAPLQSDAAERLLETCDDPPRGMDTWVLIEDDECYTKSTATIQIARRLGGIYVALGPARYLPRTLRDGVYDLVARNRYRLFGEKDACMAPTPDLQDRFLTAEDVN